MTKTLVGTPGPPDSNARLTYVQAREILVRMGVIEN